MQLLHSFYIPVSASCRSWYLLTKVTFFRSYGLTGLFLHVDFKNILGCLMFVVRMQGKSGLCRTLA